MHEDLFRVLYDKNKGLAKRDDVGEVLYNRGMINAMLTVEAIRTAQNKYGKKPMTGEQVRWGLENLKLDANQIKALGFDGLVNPVSISCNDHEGARQARIFQWDGKKWIFQTEWLQADMKVIRPMYEEAAKKYAAEKKITQRDCSKES